MAFSRSIDLSLSLLCRSTTSSGWKDKMPADPALNIGIVAPPWVPVPPPSYGGTELILDALARGLARQGHNVQLFCTGDSTCSEPGVHLRWHFDQVAPNDQMGSSVFELPHTDAAYEALSECDIIHDHTLVGPLLAKNINEPKVVTTIHGPFNHTFVDLYSRTSGQVPLIAISNDQAKRAPSRVDVAQVIHHGIDTDRYEYNPNGGDYLLCLGRMDPDKGIDHAINIARKAGIDLVIAAKMRVSEEKNYFDNVIKPLLGSGIEYVGEVDHATKVELLGGSAGLLNPIQWDEPFGLVMIEALACGTPVIATPRGAAPEIVTPNQTGFLGRDDCALVKLVNDISQIDRSVCRKTAETRFSMGRMAEQHTAFFHSVLAPSPGVVVV